MSRPITYCWDANVFLAWLGEEKTAPLVPFYAARGLLRRIDANRAPEKVFSQIVEALEA